MKLLFATMPFDGHFNPLTGLAVYLKEKGHDVRWYTGAGYAPKLAALGIPHFPFRRAQDVNQENLAERFPEYARLGNGPKAIEFALTQVFFGNTEGHYRDVCELESGFPFDALICDAAFYAARLITEKLGRRLFPIYPSPTPAPTSRQTPPPFFGLQPPRSPFHWLAHRVVDALLNSSLKRGMQMFNQLRAREGLPRFERSLWDIHVDTAEVMLQIGAPGMDYPRTDWPPSFRFIGPLLPHKRPGAGELPFRDKLARYETLVAVSQGTIDNRDPEKLFVPTLEALRGGPHLVVAATGHRNTELLRRRFPDDNIVVEDYVDFDPLLEHADLFVCNGGYGSVMQALMKGVPLLAAGKSEGKCDINARLGFCGAGLDLRTERPTPRQIRRGVDRVLGDPRYAANVARIRQELESYRPFEIVEACLLGAS